jgi:gliding motility-associated-like protein
VNITVFSINHIPIAVNDTLAIEENTQISIPVLNNDTDLDNDILTITKATKPAHGEITINANGTIMYIPDADFEGVDTFNYTISDGNGGFSTATVFIKVAKINKPPIAQDDFRSTKVNTSAVILVLGNDMDPDGDALTITGATAPANGSVIINNDGTITYTPNVGFTGTDTFYYTITDGYAISKAKVTVNINADVMALPKFWKKATTPELNSDGTYGWTYTITVNNNTNQNIDSVQVIDNLDNVFKEKGCTYEVTSISAYGTLWANGLFDGSGKIETLISDSSYVKNNSINSILIKLKVNSHNYVGPVYNQAVLSGYVSDTKFHITDLLSDDVSLPGTKDSTVTYIPEVDVFIPGGFSPNGDGLNDKFVIKHATTLKIDLEVYNRWGNRVYKSTDYQNEWDGKGTGNFLGQDLPTGTYFCTYKTIDISTGEVVNKGVKSITLNR